MSPPPPPPPPGVMFDSLELVEPTLDDVFVAKTGEHIEGEDTPSAAADER